MTHPSGRPQSRELLQRQARALGDSTRYEIFRLVADAAAPVRVAALAEHFGLNPNAVRQHLSKLTEALLLTEEVASLSTGGRPPRQYRLTPAVVGSWGIPGPYEMLSILLLRLGRGGSPSATGAEEGRRLAATYPPAADPVSVLEHEMASRGFEPRREIRDGRQELVLERCPFAVAASADPDVVCAIHRGLAMGILEGLDDGARVQTLIAYPPERGGCRLLLDPAPALDTGPDSLAG